MVDVTILLDSFPGVVLPSAYFSKTLFVFVVGGSIHSISVTITFYEGCLVCITILLDACHATVMSIDTIDTFLLVVVRSMRQLRANYC